MSGNFMIKHSIVSKRRYDHDANRKCDAIARIDAIGINLITEQDVFLSGKNLKSPSFWELGKNFSWLF